jgi:mannitol-1-phosphate 5-dehydrogenase
MFGAGNVGRGFLGQLFSESGYEVVFVDVDETLVDALNSRRAYTIQLVDNQSLQEITISPVRALRAGDAASVSRALAEASIAATAVGARILPEIAPLVAQGITWRASAGNQDPLNIIICENLKGAAATFRTMVSAQIPEDIWPYFQAHIGFVDTVIGRMVPPPPPEMRALDPSLIAVEPYKELPVDRRGFIGPIPAISGMEVCDNFGAYTARKLYIHNCGHAVLAYLGYLRGCQYGYQALEDPLVRPFLEKALAESSAGIVAVYGVQPGWLEKHAADLMHRFANRALGDTIFRLGRDPARKLSPDDRLVGAARLAEKAGVKPEAISWGIAAALKFNPPEDSLAIDFQKHLEQAGLDTQSRLDAILAEVCAIQPNEPLARLIRERYQRLSTEDWP